MIKPFTYNIPPSALSHHFLPTYGRYRLAFLLYMLNNLTALVTQALNASNSFRHISFSTSWYLATIHFPYAVAYKENEIVHEILHECKYAEIKLTCSGHFFMPSPIRRIG